METLAMQAACNVDSVILTIYIFCLQCVLPYYVATKMSRIKKPNVFAPGPTTYVRQALGTVGVESRTMGCWSHALQVKYFDYERWGRWDNGKIGLLYIVIIQCNTYMYSDLQSHVEGPMLALDG